MSDEVAQPVELPQGTPEELEDQLGKLLTDNTAIKQKMADSFGAAMQPADEVNVRLNCLMAKILPPQHRVEVEIMTQTMLGPILQKMYDQVEAQFQEFQKQQAQQAFLQGVPGVDPNAGRPVIG